MLKNICLGIFILFFLGSVTFAADTAESFKLEPIYITKNKSVYGNTYSLKYDQVENLPYNTPIEAIQNLPVDLQSRSLGGGIQTDFSMRGSNFQEVLVLFNGQRINDPQTAHYNSDIPLTNEDIEKIQAMPGVSSALFGPDSIGGALNFITKKPKENKAVIHFAAGQDNIKSGLFSVTRKADNLGVRLSLSRQSSSGFSEDTDYKNLTAFLASLVDMPMGEFSLNAGYQDKDYGAYDFYTPGLGFPSREHVKTYLVDTGFNLNQGGFVIRPNFLWRSHYDTFILDKTQKRSSYRNRHRTNVYLPSIYLQKEVPVLGKFGAGFEYASEQICSSNLGRHYRNHQSFFFDDAKEISGKASVVLSGRIDNYNDFGTNYSGSAGLKFNVSNNNVLHLGISRSIRVPTFTELYYSDPTTVGNDSLKSEKSLTYEAGSTYRNDKFSLGATIFFRDEDDSIDWVKSRVSDPRWIARNISGSAVKGVETSFGMKFLKFFEISSNYTYVDRDSNNASYFYKYGQNYSKHLAGASFLFDFSRIRGSFGLLYKKKPARGGWLLFSSRIGYRILDCTELFIEGTNLLNRSYEEIPGIPQPKRQIEAGLRFEW